MAEEAKGKELKVDRDNCIGCENCVSTAPDYFKLDDESKSKVVKGYDEADKDVIKEAIDNCPVDAISLN